MVFHGGKLGNILDAVHSHPNIRLSAAIAFQQENSATRYNRDHDYQNNDA
jgi:hypothetical protein